jgi:ubiquinone/menaquinone biosynthesis C-methylase UbiE
MSSHEHAKHLMSDARKEWQDPDKILRNIGLEKGMTLADLGCGPGFFALPAGSIVGNDGRVYAVDSDRTMLDHLDDNIKKSRIETKIIKVIESDVSNTGIPSGSVDIAFFANILHDINDKKPFFAEIKRICKPGAKVVDVDWKKAQTEHGPPLAIRLSEEESRKMLSENGFKVTKRIEAGPNHYGLVCTL